MKRIFIDTNKYLDFYRLSDNPSSELNILIELIDKKEIEVIVPRQVYYEFLRNREAIYLQFFQQYCKAIAIPDVLKDKSEIIKRANRLISEIGEDYYKKVFSPRSKINLAFKKFFQAAKIVSETSAIIQNAYYRVLRGNPPRKNDKSFGDAIIWETLLQDFSDKNIIMVSKDNDWSSELNKNIINPFLTEEWRLRNGKKIELHKHLGESINKITGKQKIKKEAIEKENELNNLPDTGLRIRDYPYTGSVITSANSSLLTGVAPLLGNELLDGNNIVNLSCSRICSCCGKGFFSPKGPSLSVFGDRCDKCDSIISFGKNCKKCGAHYHEVNNMMTVTGLNEMDLCPKCR